MGCLATGVGGPVLDECTLSNKEILLTSRLYPNREGLVAKASAKGFIHSRVFFF